MLTPNMASEDFSRFPWLQPWQAISPQGKEAYEWELQLETGPGHPLFQARVHAIARTCHSDDVLFQLENHAAQYAVVHLTFIGRREHSAQWPTVILYKDLEHWITRGMLRDAAGFEADQSDRAA